MDSDNAHLAGDVWIPQPSVSTSHGAFARTTGFSIPQPLLPSSGNSNAALLAAIIQVLGLPPNRFAALVRQRLGNSRATVSALRDRGVYVPVKTRQSLKRAAEATTSDAPPSKRFRKNESNISHSGPSAQGTQPRRLPSARLKHAQALEDIISGTSLPQTRAQAKRAARARRQHLLAAHALQHPNDLHPDLGPEFFDRQNFSAEERIGGAVRCICSNSNGDADGRWIACDIQGCDIWQHVACMGEPAEIGYAQGEAARYLCHVCDPFQHRVLLRQVRRDAQAARFDN